MDHTTLLAHEPHWGQEKAPVNAELPLLTEAEAQLYQDLVEDKYGQRLRLEQERVRFHAIRAALVRTPVATGA